MGEKRFGWRDYLSWGLLLLSAFILLWATAIDSSPGNTEQAARRVEKVLSRRMARLDGYMQKALDGDWTGWMELDNLPSDMVVYRYVDNVLQSWDHTFIVLNDDVQSRMLFQRLTDPNNNLASPFSDLTEETSFLNIGQGWYLVKMAVRNECKVIGGLRVSDAIDVQGTNSANPVLHLDDRFSIEPLSTSGGSTVSIEGRQLFKVVQETLRSAPMANTYLVWLALLLFVAAVLFHLSAHRTLRRFWACLGCIAAALVSLYLWGIRARSGSDLFSPTLYAGGPVLYSLGAVLIINLAILCLTLCVYLVRFELFRFIQVKVRSGLVRALFPLATVLAIAAIVVYTHAAFSSIVLNSNINLELYKLNELSFYSGVVYVSFLTMLVSLPLLAQFLRPEFKRLTGKSFDSFTGMNRTLVALAIGIYFVLVSAQLGYRKEMNRVEVWANRLSVDRDISLELQLRRVESSIANDFFISSLSVLPSTAPTILNRIVDSYMYSISQDYDISVLVMEPEERDPALVAYFNERIRTGVKINDNSRFVYTTTVSGHPRYTGLFTYFNQRYGVSYMLVGVEPKSSREYGGYSSLLDITDPGRVNLPPRYSYAKYSNRNLVSYKGNFAYPTVLPEEMMATSAWGGSNMVQDGYLHFITDVEDDETVIISRKKDGVMNYAEAVVFLALFAFLLFSLVALTRRRQRIFETSYYKNRISTVLMASLIVTLIAMATVSVFFVYERNDANKQEMMSDKINSLQTMMAGSFRYIDDYRQINAQELTGLLENARNMAKADITLYSPQGKAFKSTAPDVFDRMLVSDRMDEDAYENIVYKHARYFINRETLGQKRFYSLYAPLFNDNGQMVAILCSPYTDENYDFELEAVMHLVTIMSVFLILLLLARFMVSTVVDKMLGPIVEIGRKMHRTNIDNLEYIDYDRKDEISSLVDAYNLMVDDLAESTKQLAQAERDKAWSAMARQVAHEIKNPLTPMKLQLQRLIRLKQRGAAGWEDKFDEVAKVVLDHIDILTDTANEFSTFAKLYTEEPSHIDLDALLQEEISMFDNRDNIEFSYYGMEGASVMGPKPQLTRVFVNLITNSVQAIEIQRQEAIDAGQEPVMGRVAVSLRNSVQDGYYDIVFEDNGPGVPRENQPKLFTPNFTTKNAGTGLGLAICRSILEKCSADITYSKSFSFGGACFTIRYPKG